MYVTDKFLCFYSNIFGLEKKIRIPFTHVKEITKENTALVIPNAICVSICKCSHSLPLLTPVTLFQIVRNPRKNTYSDHSGIVMKHFESYKKY